MMTRLLKLYPRAWRERYGDEFAELLAQEQFRLGLILDVMGGALDAHLQELRRSRHMKRTLWLAFSFGIHVCVVGGAVYATTRRVDELPPPPLIIWIGRPPPPPIDSSSPEIKKPEKSTRARSGDGRRTLTPPTEQPQPWVGPPIDEPSDLPIGTGGVGGGGGTGGAGGGTDIGVEPAPERSIFVPPELAHKISGDMPAYPGLARKARVEGTVVAKICVDHAGAVTGVHILKSLPLLDDEVVRAVSAWRYQPFRYNGRPLPFCHLGNFRFNLQ